MLQKMKNFFNSINGSIATTIGVIAIPLMICLGTALDYARLHNAQSSLQDAADAASLASAKELGLASTKDETVKTIANDYVVASIYTALGQKKGTQSADVKTTISKSRKEVTVDISYTWTPMIIQYIHSDSFPIKVSSTASLAGEQSICVLALDPNGSKAINMGQDATLTANNCVIFSNSKDSRSISVFKQSNMTGSEIMSSGGYEGQPSSFSPLPITDTPVVEDPLKNRAAPPVGNCINQNIPKNKTYTLSPGTYCGGLTIKGNVDVKLEPGIYVIKDGPFSIVGSALIYGEDVSFYFTGNNSKFDFSVPSTVSLSARTTGPLSGILFFQDRNSNFQDFTIRSKNAEKFEGAIYLPNGRLYIDKESRIGQQSSWTAIIAKRIETGKGPNIIINSDYANSTIPVPDGIGGGTTVSLKR